MENQNRPSGRGEKSAGDHISYTTNHPSDKFAVEQSFNRLWRRIRQSPDQGAKVRRLSPWSYVAATASVVVLLVTGGYWLTGHLSNSVPEVYTLSVDKGRQQYTLPDGTLVWLNSGSQLTYTGLFNEKLREIELNGEAYFEVVKDMERSFIVKSENMQVRVTGTIFNVKSHHHEDIFVTTLIDGSVCVDKDGGTMSGITLQPGQQLFYDKISKSVTLQSVDADQYIAWKDGKIIFKNEPVREAFSKLEASFQVVFEIKNRQINDRKLTGRFDLDETIDDILATMQETLHFDYFRQNDTIVIK